MNLRHTAALALVGWYLMIPPIGPSEGKSEPLSKWTIYRDYDSLWICTAGEIELHKRAGGDPSVRPPLHFPPEQLKQFAAADCIASDDPRLKEK
jgi:hypothetical protein